MTSADPTLSVPTQSIPGSPPRRVAMQLLGAARTDGRVMRSAMALARAGVAVTIVDTDQDRDRPREEEFNGVRLVHVRIPRWLMAPRTPLLVPLKLAWLRARTFAALARAKADAYHAHDAETLPTCAAVGRARRKPVIFDAHELPLAEPAHRLYWRRRLLTSFASRQLRRLVPRCAAIITVSAPIANVIHQRYGGPPPVLVRNFPPYQPPRQSDRLRQALDLAPGTRVVLYQGGFQPDRGLDRLISAARELNPGIVLAVMGDGPTRPALAAQIDRDGMSDRARLLPLVPYEELLDWTASADLGLIIYPPGQSLNVLYCLPNKLFEYLMSGVPVLSSPLVAVVEVLSTYQVGAVVNSTEPRDIAHAINALLADPSSLAQLRRNALVASAGALRWEVEREALITLYQRVLGVPGAWESATSPTLVAP